MFGNLEPITREELSPLKIEVSGHVYDDVIWDQESKEIRFVSVSGDLIIPEGVKFTYQYVYE